MQNNDNDLKQLLEKVFEERGIDFRQYNLNSIKRRVARRLAATGAETYVDYAMRLDTNSEEYKNLLDDLTINVSHFFRNPLTFELINKIVLPELIAFKQRTMDNMIRVWSAGCANGEEPYSIAILLSELLGKQIGNYNVTIYATDIDSKALKKAKTGGYAECCISEVKKGLLDKYFHHDKNYRIKEDVKELVDFSFHDLSSEKSIAPTRSVFTNFDIVLCRNVLIYFTKALQTKVFSNIKNVLNPKGYLVLGEAETLPDNMQRDFICKGGLNNIYQLK